jgi:hypothetical protein
MAIIVDKKIFLYVVIPTKAGIQDDRLCRLWIPAFAGMTGRGVEVTRRI